MYCIKPTWVGQTFALAASGDSGGRKSRIRRSKEERKAMVESFIKRYQILNDGNFPSLNLTHKEVGGSFYTVREIVREIIQENKVLGPARFNSEAEKNGEITEDYSLGSSSLEMQVLLSVNELDVVSNHQETESAGLTLEGNGYYITHMDLDSVQFSSELQAVEMSQDPDELAGRKSVSKSLDPSSNSTGQFVNENPSDDVQFANGTHSNGVFKESDEMSGEGSLVSETSKGDRQKELVGAYNAKLTLPTKELVVETFPLRPAIKEIDDISSTSTGSWNINGTLNNVGSKHDGNGISDLDKLSSPDGLSDMVIAKGGGGSEHSSVPGMVFQHAETNDGMIQHEEGDLTYKTMEMLDSSAIKEESTPVDQGCMDKITSRSGSTSNIVESAEEINGVQPKKAPQEMTYIENSSSGTSNKNTSKGPAFAIANGDYVRRENRAKSGASPTVDRIDLESWESKKHLNQETNPLLAFFKAFVGAFVKFWSE